MHTQKSPTTYWRNSMKKVHNGWYDIQLKHDITAHFFVDGFQMCHPQLIQIQFIGRNKTEINRCHSCEHCMERFKLIGRKQWMVNVLGAPAPRITRMAHPVPPDMQEEPKMILRICPKTGGMIGHYSASNTPHTNDTCPRCGQIHDLTRLPQRHAL